MKLVLATRNPGKLDEVREILSRYEIASLPDDFVLPPETGETFAENALIKARAVAGALAVEAIGDDSGIAAQALDGRPGVRSARYAGPHATDSENLEKFIAEVPAGSPIAYVCVIAHVLPDGSSRTFEGRCEGVMADAPRGDGGFGYDPIFVPGEDPRGRTMAELSPAEKHRISHRGRALRAMLSALGDAA